MDFDTYTLVILRRGERADEFPDDELSRLQEQHLAHLAALKEQGHLLAAGPFADQHDETFRGMCLYRVPLEEARRLAESDPSVRAGRMRVDALTWLTQKGALAFPA
jgi:uncharacterized protein YciI